jgi:hypothetical protein
LFFFPKVLVEPDSKEPMLFVIFFFINLKNEMKHNENVQLEGQNTTRLNYHHQFSLINSTIRDLLKFRDHKNQGNIKKLYHAECVAAYEALKISQDQIDFYLYHSNCESDADSLIQCFLYETYVLIKYGSALSPPNLWSTFDE